MFRNIVDDIHIMKTYPFNLMYGNVLINEYIQSSSEVLKSFLANILNVNNLTVIKLHKEKSNCILFASPNILLKFLIF